MVWNTNDSIIHSDKNLMRKLEDDEIVIGQKHPMLYAFSILVILHKKGIAKVYINKKQSFVCSHTHITKSIKDRWEEVKRFVIEDAGAQIIDNKESEYYEVVKLTW